MGEKYLWVIYLIKDEHLEYMKNVYNFLFYIKNGRVNSDSKVQLLWDLELRYMENNNLVKKKKQVSGNWG